jgi:DNA-binding response OmpR family regulator
MSQTILIVDDCTDIARIIARYLQSVGYRTLTASDGIAARDLIGEIIPDGIVLDLMMPGLTGSELLHDLRRTPETQNVPVVLVSARVGYGGTHFSTEAEADYCVGKPFTKQQILHAVRTAIKKRATALLPASEMPVPTFLRPVAAPLR